MDATSKTGPGWHFILPPGIGDGSVGIRYPWDRVGMTETKWNSKSKEEQSALIRTSIQKEKEHGGG